MTENPLTGLESALRGELITREDMEAFDAARFRGWNHDLNTRTNPLGFVVASGVRDIVMTLNYCRSNNIPITVRGKGAHSPYGMANDAVVIDTMKMTAVRVDAEGTVNLTCAERDLGRIDGRFLNHSGTRHLRPNEEGALSQYPVVGWPQ